MNSELLCPDSNPSLLNFLDPSIAPPLLFYSYIPTIILSLILGFIVFKKDGKSLLGKTLFILAASFSVWVLDIFILWIAAYNSHVMFGWQVNPLPEIVIFISAIYFIYVFTDVDRKNISNWLKLFFMALFGAFVFFLPTKYNIVNYDINSCEGVLGPLWDFMYSFEIFALGWIGFICYSRYRKYIKDPKTADHAKKIVYVGIGMTAFLGLFISSNILGEALAFQEISFFGALGMLLFLGFLSYLIVRFQSFNIRVIGADLLVIGLFVLTASLLFINDLDVIHFVITITLAGLLVFGYSLLKGVRREIEQRKRIETLAADLASANEQLYNANERLKELDRQKTEFVSLASHQLRSPITAIKGYTSMLMEGSFGPLDEKAKGAVDVIFQSAQKLVMVIEDFLNITRIELGRMKYEMTEVDLKKAVDQVVKEMKPIAQTRGLQFTFSTQRGHDYLVTADLGKITQVITNVIDNAIKYTPEGSIKVRLEKADGKNRISVTDTGVGMNQATQERLFQKFTRAYNASKTNASGTGLGLYVAKQMIEAHKGKLWVESAGEGQGSTFYIEL